MFLLIERIKDRNEVVAGGSLANIVEIGKIMGRNNPTRREFLLGHKNRDNIEIDGVFDSTGYTDKWNLPMSHKIQTY